MVVIADPTETSKLGTIAELRQVSVATDADIALVNEQLAEGWRLLHIGYLHDRMVYVLGRPIEQSRRRTGFLASATPADA
jgi:hypothetical protein